MEGDEAQVQRLIAEREGKPYAPANSNPSQLLQASLWRQRQDEYQQNLNDLDARLNNARATLAGAEHDVKLYGERLDHAQAIEKMRTTLEKDGYGSKLNTLLATDSSTDIRRLQAEAQSLAQQTRHTIESLTAQRAVFIGKWRDDIETAMITVQSDLSQTRGELAKAQRIHDLITLEAPEDAVVLNIANASAGSVVGQDPQPLFTLVPLRGNLEAEVEIDAKDSGFILPGDTVRIKLDAYNFLRHGTIQGVIKTISEGTFTTGLNNESRSPYFKARIRITDTNLRSVPKSFRLVPGMTLAGDVLVGHRTMLSYLVEGGLKTGTEAMREP
jgi:HlyD family type I secretion membrane fusion protein